MPKRLDEDHYSARETDERVAAALRGARIAGSQHRESVTPKRPKPQQKKRPKTKRS